MNASESHIHPKLKITLMFIVPSEFYVHDDNERWSFMSWLFPPHVLATTASFHISPPLLCPHFNDHTISPPTERAMVPWPRPTTERFSCLFTALNRYNFTTINHTTRNIFVHMALSTFWIIFERQFRRYGIPGTRNHQGQNKTPLFLRKAPNATWRHPSSSFCSAANLSHGWNPSLGHHPFWEQLRNWFGRFIFINSLSPIVKVIHGHCTPCGKCWKAEITTQVHW